MEAFDFFKTLIIGYNNEVNLTEIGPETKLTEDLGLDSLDLVEIGMEIEREFGIIIPDSEVEQWETVGDVIKSTERTNG